MWGSFETTDNVKDTLGKLACGVIVFMKYATQLSLGI